MIYDYLPVLLFVCTTVIRFFIAEKMKTGYDIFIKNHYKQLYKRLLKYMKENTYDENYQRHFLNLVEREIPFILLERNLAHPKINCIWVDNITGGYLATRHLTGKGHRRIAHIAGPLHFQSAMDRLEGYKKALAEAGSPPNKKPTISGDFYWKTGQGAAREILRRSPGCTAIFTANDTMALGALQAIKEAGLTVPDDIAVVGLTGKG